VSTNKSKLHEKKEIVYQEFNLPVDADHIVRSGHVLILLFLCLL